MKQRIIAVDFDGTCVTHEFPKVGRDIGAAPVLKALAAVGHRLILWTMRSDGRDAINARNGQPLENPNPLSDAVRWFSANGIPLWAVNGNPEQQEWTASPKAYANLYIDDAALGAPLLEGLKGERPFVCWKTIRLALEAAGYLETETVAV